MVSARTFLREIEEERVSCRNSPSFDTRGTSLNEGEIMSRVRWRRWRDSVHHDEGEKKGE